MGCDAAEPGGGTGGKRLEQVHRNLVGRGPATDAQLVLLVVKRFNCTPTEAARELRRNPWIMDVIATELYQEAYVELERWNAMTAEQRKGQTAPSGLWVRRVAANRTRLLNEAFEDRDDALRREGRA